ncbi:zinc-binding dehydrogenase [Streptomyces rimosus]|uniref:zinc-binding dehydrogenase n=1 Tax=Streptomyces rimosus TaxID=1927 RepID=UPI0037B6DE16
MTSVAGGGGGVGARCSYWCAEWPPAGQIARLHGAARVIGSTSSQRKADILTKELGYAAVPRDAGSVEEQLRAAAPDGVDVVIDQVGGDQLKAAAVARSGVRVALNGALAGQLGDAPAIGINPVALITRTITLRGAPLFGHLDIVPEWTEFFGRGLPARAPPGSRCTVFSCNPGVRHL